MPVRCRNRNTALLTLITYIRVTERSNTTCQLDGISAGIERSQLALPSDHQFGARPARYVAVTSANFGDLFGHADPVCSVRGH